MRVVGYSTRTRERVALKIPLRVTYREDKTKSWSASSFIREATTCGVGFDLCRPVEPGRLVHLSFKMPGALRAYDYFKTEYQIWGLVRNIRSHFSNSECSYNFSFGVALIGQYTPMSYDHDPATLYDIKPIRSRNGLWVLREKPKYLIHYNRGADRNQLTKKVHIEVMDEHGIIVQTCDGETVNISQNGAAIHTESQIPLGSFVRITNPENSLTILSLIRSSRLIENGIQELNVQFVDKIWQD